jgi:GntR family transcriptional regulator
MKSPLVLVEDKELGRSRYAQLADILRNRVKKGEWIPGGVALPSEQALAQEHGVALGTMRRALQILVEEGLIERIHGRGTFVRTGLTGATMSRFFRFDSENGEVPTSSIISMKQVVASAEVLTRLGRAAGELTLHIVRVRSFGESPCMLEHIWLPLPEFESLMTLNTRPTSDLLYPIYAEICGIHVYRAVDEISFGLLSAAHARHLDLSPGHPCAVVRRRAYDHSGRCIEARTTRGDANAFHYTVSLN